MRGFRKWTHYVLILIVLVIGTQVFSGNAQAAMFNSDGTTNLSQFVKSMDDLELMKLVVLAYSAEDTVNLGGAEYGKYEFYRLISNDKGFPQNDPLKYITYDNIQRYQFGDYSMYVIMDNTTAIAIIPGTDWLQPGDLGEDAVIALDNLINNVSTLGYDRKTYQIINSLPVNNVIVTGHSLGGYLAISAALNVSKVSRCVAFDPPGRTKSGLDLSRAGCITTYRNKYSVVSGIGEHINLKETFNLTNNPALVFSNHSSSNMYAYKGGDATLNEYWANKGYTGSNTMISEEKFLAECTIYPTHCQVEVTKAEGSTYLKTLPCSKGTNPLSLDVDALGKGVKLTVTAVYKHPSGMYWYKVASNDTKGVRYEKDTFVFTGDTKPIDESWEKLKQSDFTFTGNYPSTLQVGENFTVTGTVATKYGEMCHVHAVIDQGDGLKNHSHKYRMSDVEQKLTSFTFNSSFASKLEFHTLPAGNYTYHVCVVCFDYYSVDGRTLERHYGGITPLERQFSVVGSKTQIEQAIDWALDIAEGPNEINHQYSMDYRNEPNYDCSSFVYYALKNAGFSVGSSAFATSSMMTRMKSAGFTWIPWREIGDASNLKRGDILLYEAKTSSEYGHTEIYIGNNQLVGAHQHYSSNPSKDISVVSYFTHKTGWDGAFRWQGSSTEPVEQKVKISFDLQGGSVGTYTQQAVIAGTNCERGYNSIVYNVSGATVGTNKWGKEAAVDASGKIIYYREYESDTQITVPSGGFVVSQHQKVQVSDGVVWGSKLGDYIGMDYANMKAYLYTDVDSYLVNHKTVKEGTTYGTLPTPTRDGYTFIGWFTDANGGTKITEDTNYSVSKLYAHWTEAHDYVPTVHKPTCEERGYTEYNCTTCSESYQDDFKAALGHDYTRQTVKKATCTAAGSYKDTCSRCSKTQTGQIDALGHSYVYETVAGDCVTAPIQHGTCKRCGNEVDEISEEAWSAWSTTAPTGVDSSDIQSRKEYRYRTKQTATSRESSLSGWTLEGTTQVWDEYGGWSWWTNDKLTASDSTEVETAKVYRYYYFLCNKCGDHNPLSGGCTCGGTSNDFHEYWSTVPYSQSSSSVVSYATHKRTTTSVGGGTVYYFSSGNLNDTAIGTKDSGSSAAVIAQGYRSRTRTSHTEYTYYKWSSWSGWSTTSVTATSTREVSTRTVYRYNLYANASHDYTYKVTKKPTASATGTLTGTCSKCSGTTTVTLPKLDSVRYSVTVTKEPTSTTEGTAKYTLKDKTYGTVAITVTLPKITQLALPSGLTKIESEAFSNVSAEVIIIPASVKTIEELAFADCPNLRYLVFQGNPTSIASNILEGCSNVTIRCTSGGYVSRWAAVMGYAVEVY